VSILTPHRRGHQCLGIRVLLSVDN
jgi:hypothetical protein